MVFSGECCPDYDSLDLRVQNNCVLSWRGRDIEGERPVVYKLRSRTVFKHRLLSGRIDPPGNGGGDTFVDNGTDHLTGEVVLSVGPLEQTDGPADTVLRFSRGDVQMRVLKNWSLKN